MRPKPSTAELLGWLNTQRRSVVFSYKEPGGIIRDLLALHDLDMIAALKKIVQQQRRARKARGKKR